MKRFATLLTVSFFLLKSSFLAASANATNVEDFVVAYFNEALARGEEQGISAQDAGHSGAVVFYQYSLADLGGLEEKGLVSDEQIENFQKGNHKLISKELLDSIRRPKRSNFYQLVITVPTLLDHKMCEIESAAREKIAHYLLVGPAYRPLILKIITEQEAQRSGQANQVDRRPGGRAHHSNFYHGQNGVY
jgi:hypothetical protein